MLLDAGAELNVPAKDLTQPLQFAIGRKQAETPRILLARGADPKAVDEHGQTCLMTAAYHGLVEIMEALVAAGVDIAAKDDKGYTALTNAAYSGELAAATWLLDHGADANIRGTDGMTALAFAKKQSHPEMAALLQARGAAE